MVPEGRPPEIIFRIFKKSKRSENWASAPKQFGAESATDPRHAQKIRIVPIKQL